jgi:hypothetical protein
MTRKPLAPRRIMGSSGLMTSTSGLSSMPVNGTIKTVTINDTIKRTRNVPAMVPMMPPTTAMRKGKSK